MDKLTRFHKRRLMFCYYNGLKLDGRGDSRTHRDWMEADLGVTAKEYPRITRGYYLDGNIVLYRGEFEESDEILKELRNGLFFCLMGALDFMEEDKMYMGAIPSKIGDVWEPKVFIGTCGVLGVLIG